MFRPLWVLPALFVLGIAASNQIDSIFIRLYLGDTMNVYVDEKLKNASLLLEKMDRRKPTLLYIPGFNENLTSNSVATIINPYLERGDHNLLAVDYTEIARQSYPEAAWDASAVGKAVAGALDKMVEDGFNQGTLHVVGHSLGGQVAGYIGRSTSFKIPRITGLDPAGPLFNLLEKRLNHEDAKFVDIIHTDLGGYGNARTTGTVDFYPNGGHRIQPGCPKNPAFYSTEDFCSHYRSWYYYAESILHPKNFIAVECKDSAEFRDGDCSGNKEIPMGIATPTDATGTYYLKTAPQSPFGLGENGACVANEINA